MRRREDAPSLDEGDFVYQAVVLVGELGERRAGARVLELLQVWTGRANVPDLPGSGGGILDQMQAARTLGRLRYAEALDTLLELAGDAGISYALHQHVLEAIWRIGDKRAIPVLDRVAQSGRDNARQAASVAQALREGEKLLEWWEKPAPAQ